MLLFKICQPHHSIHNKIKNQLYNYQIYHCLISTKFSKIGPPTSPAHHTPFADSGTCFSILAFNFCPCCFPVGGGAGCCLNGIPWLAPLIFRCALSSCLWGRLPWTTTCYINGLPLCSSNTPSFDGLKVSFYYTIFIWILLQTIKLAHWVRTKTILFTIILLTYVTGPDMFLLYKLYTVYLWPHTPTQCDSC